MHPGKSIKFGNFLRSIFFVLICINCTHRESSVQMPLQLQKLPNGQFLILLNGHTKSREYTRTSILLPSDFEQDVTHSFYMPKLEGTFMSSEFILSPMAPPTHPEHFIKTLVRGYVKLEYSYIQISLDVAQYADGVNVSGWLPYEFNGNYRFEALN